MSKKLKHKLKQLETPIGKALYEYFPDEIPYRSNINRREFAYAGGSSTTQEGMLPFLDRINTNKKDIEILKP